MPIPLKKIKIKSLLRTPYDLGIPSLVLQNPEKRLYMCSKLMKGHFYCNIISDNENLETAQIYIANLFKPWGVKSSLENNAVIIYCKLIKSWGSKTLKCQKKI